MLSVLFVFEIYIEKLVFRWSFHFTIDNAGVDSDFGFYLVYCNIKCFISYEIKICLLLNDLTFSCCFHVFLNNFFVPQMVINRERWGSKFLTLNQCYARHNEFGWLPFYPGS